MTEFGNKLRLGEALVEEGVISQEQLSRALAEQKATGRMLGEMLVEKGLLNGPIMLRVLARQLGVPSCQLRHGLIDYSLLKLIGEEEAERLKVIPM